VRKAKKSYILVGVLAILAILGVSVPGIIRVGEVSCESQFGPCRKEVEEALNKFRGQSLRAARGKIKTLLASEVYVETFDVRFSLPAKLKVVIIEKKPVYALKDLVKNAIALTDQEGYIVAIVEGTNLPLLATSEAFGAVGEKVGGSTLFGLGVMADMFEFYQVKEGTLERESLRVKIDQGPEVIFPLEGERAVLISSLRLIISKLEAEEEGKSQSASIDLRFKNPVVTYP
jgi:hypothetical protein